MKKFYSPRTKLFGAYQFRQTALPVIAIGLVYGTLSHFAPKPVEAPAAAAPVMAAAAPVVTPAPNIIMQMAPAATASLKTTMDEASASPVKPAPVAAAAPAEPVGKLASIQKSISGILDQGRDFMGSGKTVSVGRGDTLMNLLVRNHVPREQAYEAITALTKVYDPRDLNPNHKITVFFHRNPAIADPQFSGLSIQKDVVSTVRVSRADNGDYKADQQDKPLHSEMKGFSGTIDDSLFMSAENAGVPDNVILDLIKMYSWGVDFQRDIQGGDKFEVMYREPVTAEGKAVPGKEEIVYARLILSDRDMPLYRYKDSYGDVDFYDNKGQGAKKPLMKTPVDGARLSSGFGMRTHPVLGYSKMHKGVDFAAPRGTPIYAAGDGVIERMGPFSTYGNYVKLRHRAGLETAYAHMNGFKAGLHAGSRVKQGQVIGYVGATGRATGAHLHYEILINNTQVNPTTVKLAGGKALSGKDLKNFKAMTPGVDKTFKGLGKAPEDAAVALNAINVGGPN